jgi:hypothetical protein
MKNIIKIFIVALTLALFTGFGIQAMAQGPPPPPPSDHGEITDQPAGGGAPIGSAVTLMLGLFAAYGAKKAWDARQKLDE